MVANVNLNHPRTIKTNEEDGTASFEKLPLCTPIGQLLTPMMSDVPHWEDFDQLGIGVTLYFKMIKIMIYILIISTLLALPYMMVFS